MPHGLPPAPEHGKAYANGGPVYWHIILSLGPGRATLETRFGSCDRPPLRCAPALDIGSLPVGFCLLAPSLASFDSLFGTSTSGVQTLDVSHSLRVAWL